MLNSAMPELREWQKPLTPEKIAYLAVKFDELRRRLAWMQRDLRSERLMGGRRWP